MSTPTDIPSRAHIGESEPFSADAVDSARARLMSSDDERLAVRDAAAALARDGYVIMEGALPPATLDAVREALDEINARTRKGIFAFEGYQTHRAYNVVSATRAFDSMVCDMRVLALIETYFGETPQLSACMGMTLYNGQQAQPLHRDTGHYTLPWPRPPLEVNAIWAFDDFTVQSGATRFIRGSHQLPSEQRPDGEVRDAQMPAGSVLVYDGSLWHGGGACSTDSPRRSVNCIYARQWLRQQDNMYLQFDADTVLSLPKLMQRLLGYWMYGYTLGVVDGRPPLEVLRERAGQVVGE